MDPTLTPAALADALRAAAFRLDPSLVTPPDADPPTPSDGPKRFSVPMVQAVYRAADAGGAFGCVGDEAQFIGNLLDAVGAMTAPPTGPADVEALFLVALAAYGNPGISGVLDYPAAWASLSASFAAMPA